MVTSKASDNEQTKTGPSGYVLGPDGKPCKICTGFKAWSHTLTQNQSSPNQKPTNNSSAFVDPPATTKANPSRDQVRLDHNGLREDCPADVERLGRHTWTFLHTTAAYYPPKPTEAQQTSMLQLLNALPVLYPCRNCAEDLEQEVKRNPPDVSSRDKLEAWMCATHNEVNRRLGKEEFDCSLVSQRWRDGWKDGRCDP
ncbi:ERV/ALR sulfhydryl oxidase domain-containing protein [Melampsora americana]|nr:ERV/ALR sulfhydryl oxidase domain-containing protein [Melampsora americana]